VAVVSVTAEADCVVTVGLHGEVVKEFIEPKPVPPTFVA
jgi:hypothetical protein